ncbi:hypothetical protein [Amycolatopsis sp. WGS_07]|uniref:hypothetical protein n=1 Tax=Amycolatopsis sp. WGS_07 TaxID=3076764 RepID=UPI003873565A
MATPGKLTRTGSLPLGSDAGHLAEVSVASATDTTTDATSPVESVASTGSATDTAGSTTLTADADHPFGDSATTTTDANPRPADSTAAATDTAPRPADSTTAATDTAPRPADSAAAATEPTLPPADSATTATDAAPSPTDSAATTDATPPPADSIAATTEPTPQPSDSPDATAASPARSPRRTLTWAAGIALAAATAFAAWSAWSWHTAATSPASTTGATRDEAVTAGRALITTVTTFDPQHRDQDLAHWQAATTGALQTSLPSTIPPSGAAMTGHVLDAGLSDLDPQAGTAKLLASVEITVTKDGTAQPTRRTRLTATLARTASGWKLSSLDQLGVAAS